MNTPALNLDLVPQVLWPQAREEFDAGDASGLLGLADNQAGLALVFDNLPTLQDRGIYEECLVHAFTGCRTNNRGWSPGIIEWMFTAADRDRLRAVGSPLPGDGPFTVYRGIAGRGRARRARGMSWTPSLPVACWFATRFGLEAPAVVTVTVPAVDVLCYYTERDEEEFITLPPAKVRRVRLTAEQLTAHAAEIAAKGPGRTASSPIPPLSVNGHRGRGGNP